MTADAAELFRSSNGRRMRVLWLAMVGQVVLEDGTVFDIESLPDDIGDFLISDY